MNGYVLCSVVEIPASVQQRDDGRGCILAAGREFLEFHHIVDLGAHRDIGHALGDDIWRMATPKGDTVTVAVKGRLRSNKLSAILAAARHGLGLAAMPRYVAADSLAGGQVVEVLKDHTLPEQEIHAVFPSPKLVPGKVSAFVAYLQGRFGPRWWDNLPKA